MTQEVVLLQTDIVDSTSLNERLGDATNGDLRARHDFIARDLLTAWQGKELERSDGFLLCFPAVAAAVEYAMAYHRAMAELPTPIQARAAIHVGALEFRQNSESHVQLGAKEADAGGLSIALTVRIMSLATGRQTLMSPAAHAALGRTERRLMSHGHWRLKGFEVPLELFEIGDDEAPFVPPPDSTKVFRVVWKNDHWLPRREIPHSLPAERNSFVGRKASLHDLETRIEQSARLLTLLGPGGTGKTRLIQHFGWAHLGDFPGGVWFCDLSNAKSLDGLYSAVAQGLNLPLGQVEPVEQIGSAIAGRDACLVILDNFEQIVRDALPSVGRWVDQAIGATFVITSRSRLGLDGEQILPVAPLDQTEGSELFVRRARASGRNLDHSAEDDAQVRTLIDLLDGLPLAIELAAARARVLDVKTLVARMRDRFGLLTSGEGRPSRQATLRTTFDWSWELLTTTDRRALAQLSVFEGGFSFDAAASVCAPDSDSESIDPLDVLQSLLDKSWIQRTSTARFTLLRSIQDYAAERLRADPGLCRSTEARHGDYYASLDERAATVDRCVEVDNLIVATKRAVASGAAGRAAALLDRCWFALKLRGPYRTAAALATEVLALPSLEAADRAAAEFVAGDALQSSGASDAAIGHFEQGLAIARACGARQHEARLLCGIGERCTDATRYEDARRMLDEALTMGEQLHDEPLRCGIFNALGNLQQSLGDASGAQRWYEQALTVARGLEDRRWEGGLFGNLGGMHHLQGHAATAQHYYDLAIARAEELGDKRWENNARCNLGLLLGETGDLSHARQELERASVSARELGHNRLECVAACNLGVICDKASDVAASRRYYQRALDLAQELRDIRMEGQTRGHFGLLLARCGEYREAQAHFEIGETILEKVSDDLSLGAILCQRAEAGTLAGEKDAPLTCWQRARAIANRIDAEKDSPLRTAIDRLAPQFEGH